jgi:hypothetical protein
MENCAFSDEANCAFSDELCRKYLDGTMFSGNLSVSYEFSRPIRHRLDVLETLSKGKNILHVGCCDHIDLIGGKIANDTWLHGILSRTASTCVGVDIDVDAVREARRLSGLDNIVLGDVAATSRLAEIEGHMFDYAVFGEVLEHIGNPVQFLRAFLENYGSVVSDVVITVPNAFRGGNFRDVIRATETLNSDHRFFFTPYTVAKVAWDAGLDPVSVKMAIFGHAGPVKRAVLSAFPLLAENIVYVGKPRRRRAQSAATS